MLLLLHKELLPRLQSLHPILVLYRRVPKPRSLVSQKGATPMGASHTRSASPTTPLVISASDPFVTLSQAMKDGSLLVVTPSSIPSSATQGPDANLSSDEGFKKVLEDSEDKLIMKKRVSDSDEDDGGEHK